MDEKIEKHYCKCCGKETDHVLILVRKKTGFENSSNRKFKKFIAGFIKSWFLGSFIAAMDDFYRHLICKICGEKIIDD
jgi:ribosomal protein L44E